MASTSRELAILDLIVHELRTPLSVAAGSLAQVSDGSAFTAAQQSAAERVERSLKTLTTLTDQLRAWSRTSDSTARMPVSLAAALARALDSDRRPAARHRLRRAGGACRCPDNVRGRAVYSRPRLDRRGSRPLGAQPLDRGDRRDVRRPGGSHCRRRASPPRANWSFRRSSSEGLASRCRWRRPRSKSPEGGSGRTAPTGGSPGSASWCRAREWCRIGAAEAAPYVPAYCPGFGSGSDATTSPVDASIE